MNKQSIARITAALALGAACSLPVMAQDTSTTTSDSQASSQVAQSTAPSDTRSDTQTMGAGPDDRTTRRDDDRDMGWIGLLGLAGLLGLRRRHHHDDRGDYNRTQTHTTTAR